MISEAKDVTEYLKSVPAKRREALIRLRKLCTEILTAYEESMAYKMPCYSIDGKVAIAFAHQKNHISFYCLIHEVMLNNAALLDGLNHGKGCIRFSNPDKIDFDVIKKLLTETLKSAHNPC